MPVIHETLIGEGAGVELPSSRDVFSIRSALSGRHNIAVVGNLEEMRAQTEEFASRALEDSEHALAHVLKAAELEWDRIDLIELESLKLEYRRKRKGLMSQIQRARPGVLYTSGMREQVYDEDASFRFQVSTRSFTSFQKSDESKLRQEDIRTLRKQKVIQKQELRKELERVYVMEKEARQLELARMEREHKVEQDLLSRDIYKHYTKMLRDLTTDMGFTKEVVLMFSKQFSDPEEAELLRRDVTYERDVEMHKALSRLHGEQKREEEMLIEELERKQEAAMQSKEAAVRKEQAVALSKLRASLTKKREQTTAKLEAARDKEEELEAAVERGQAAAAEGRQRVQRLFEGGHTLSRSRQEAQALSGELKKKLEQLAEAEREAVQRLRLELRQRRVLNLQTLEMAWRDRSRDALNKRMQATEEAAARKQQASSSARLLRLHVARGMAQLYPERFRVGCGKIREGVLLAAADGEILDPSATTLEGGPAPLTAAGPGHSSQAVLDVGRQTASHHAWCTSSLTWRRSDHCHPPPSDLPPADGAGQGCDPSTADGGRGVLQRRARAAQGYVAVLPEEVSVEEGDALLLLGEEADGWVEVRVLGAGAGGQGGGGGAQGLGRSGKVPAACLQPVWQPALHEAGERPEVLGGAVLHRREEEAAGEGANCPPFALPWRRSTTLPSKALRPARADPAGERARAGTWRAQHPRCEEAAGTDAAVQDAAMKPTDAARAGLRQEVRQRVVDVGSCAVQFAAPQAKRRPRRAWHPAAPVSSRREQPTPEAAADRETAHVTALAVQGRERLPEGEGAAGSGGGGRWAWTGVGVGSKSKPPVCSRQRPRQGREKSTGDAGQRVEGEEEDLGAGELQVVAQAVQVRHRGLRLEGGKGDERWLVQRFLSDVGGEPQVGEWEEQLSVNGDQMLPDDGEDVARAREELEKLRAQERHLEDALERQVGSEQGS